MGASVNEIDRTYGHLVRESAGAIRARLDARSAFWRKKAAKGGE